MAIAAPGSVATPAAAMSPATLLTCFFALAATLAAGSPRICPEHWVACSTGGCISPFDICDGANHCPRDGEDEQHCGSPRTCPEHHVACSSGRCARPQWVCDGTKQCPDGEDEQNCGSPRTCPEHYVACSSGRCLPPDWACDGDKDCPDGEDEQHCGSPRTCPEHHVACSSGRCVTPYKVCDGVKHCPDGEDEQNCGSPRTCPEHWVACASGLCVTPEWVCDRRKQCPDNEDEDEAFCGGLLNTTTTTTTSPPPTKTGSRRACPEHWVACSSGRCAAPYSVCDGVKDCPDGEDELLCGSPRTCPEHYVACSTGNCVAPHYICDGVNHCPAGEDEDKQLCGSPRTCPEHHVACSSGICVTPHRICDGAKDCPDGEDELHCGSPRACPEHHVACSTGRCVPPEWVCDGKKECSDGEDEDKDEQHCWSLRTCPEHYVACSTGNCVAPHYICDGVNHCPAGEDEDAQLCGGLLHTTTTTTSATTAPRAPPAPGARPAHPACAPTLTRLRAGAACAGQTVFEDHFDSLRESVWQVEQYIPVGHPEIPFVSYQRSQVSVEGGTLRVAAGLQQQQPGWSNDSIISGELDLLQGCTSGSSSACSVEAAGASIVPPVVSGRVTSKPGFAFTYGTISVRAKLPQGDWLYPEILLEPLVQKYGFGSLKYKSGVVRVAGARGNKDLSWDIINFGNKVLYAGPIIEKKCRNALLDSKPSRTFWGDDFHVYSVRWTPERITMLVDGAEWGHVEAKPDTGLRGNLPATCRGPASPDQQGIAPFDDHFYVTLGLAAGGITEFPNNVKTTDDRPKPWKNEGSKAVLTFWRDLPAWHATWQHPELLVDYVKVVAL